MKYSYEQIHELVGANITLTALKAEELTAVAEALVSPTTWFSRFRDIDSTKAFVAYFEKLLRQQETGERVTLVAQLNDSGEIVAMSTFHSASVGFKRVEIGFTWIADQWQRTFVNTEMKILMLTHAFEVMKTMRVEFSVDPKNERSRKAMERLGAQYEGTLRKWRYLSENDGGDRCIYSIIDDEWPSIKAKHLIPV